MLRPAAPLGRVCGAAVCDKDKRDFVDDGGFIIRVGMNHGNDNGALSPAVEGFAMPGEWWIVGMNPVWARSFLTHHSCYQVPAFLWGVFWQTVFVQMFFQ